MRALFRSLSLQCDLGADPGYRVRILDGNHLGDCDKCHLPLRDFRGAVLAGQSLIVYDPGTSLVVDLVLCEDAHSQERAPMGRCCRCLSPMSSGLVTAIFAPAPF